MANNLYLLPGYRRALLSIADGMNTVTVIFGGFFVKMTAELLLLLVTAGNTIYVNRKEQIVVAIACHFKPSENSD